MLVDGSDSENGVLAHVGVAVLETGAGGREQGFDEFGFVQLAEEAEGVAADVLVGVLEVHANAVAV